MKKLFSILFFVLVSGVAFGQAISWSAPMSDDKKFPFLKILGETDAGYYLLRSNLTFGHDKMHSGFRTRKYILQRFDENLRLQFSQPLAAPCEDCQVADVGIVGTQVAVLYSSFEKSKRLLRLYIGKVDHRGAASGKSVLLLEIGAERMDEENQPDLIFSQDEGLIACALRSVAKTGNEQFFSAAIFDTSLNVIARKDIKVPVKEKLFGPVTSVLSNDGNFYILGIEFLTEKRVKNPGESFYRLLSLNVKKDLITEHEIRLENKFLTDVAISADNLNRKIVVSGFYSDKTTYSTSGVFFYSLSEDSLMQTPVVTSTFSQDFIRKLAPGRGRRDELVNYSIDRSVLRKDGGAAIVAESFNISSRSYWDYYLQMWVYHYYYHYGNIIALSLNPDGSILWNNIIQKDQNSTDDGGYYSSYFPAIINGRIVSIYNKYVTEQSSVLMTAISGTGEQQTTTLFDESLNTAVIPHSAKQVDEQTILIPVERDSDPYLVKITFD